MSKGAVAPHAGAWIETQWLYAQDGVPEESHPMRVRGLKRNCSWTLSALRASHPMRVRGLKLKVTFTDGEVLEGFVETYTSVIDSEDNLDEIALSL